MFYIVGNDYIFIHLSSVGSTTHFQTPTMNASSSPGFGFGCTTSGQATTQFGTSSNLCGTSTYSGGIQVPFTGKHLSLLSQSGLIYS